MQRKTVKDFMTKKRELSAFYSFSMEIFSVFRLPSRRPFVPHENPGDNEGFDHNEAGQGTVRTGHSRKDTPWEEHQGLRGTVWRVVPGIVPLCSNSWAMINQKKARK